MFNFTKYYYKFQIKESNSNRWVDAYFDSYWQILVPINYVTRYTYNIKNSITNISEQTKNNSNFGQIFYNCNSYNLILRNSTAHEKLKDQISYLVMSNINKDPNYYDIQYNCAKTKQRLIMFNFIKLESNKTKEEFRKVIYEYSDICKYLKFFIDETKTKKKIEKLKRTTLLKNKSRKRLVKFNGEKI